ncbi:MAG: hypothetical protein AB1724_10445 [Thermodesulfobacteriota bacterium]
MKIPPYWARARYEGRDRQGDFRQYVACGWSFSSLLEARNQASARVKRIFELFSAGQKPDFYEYHDRPIKEEIIEEIKDAGEPVAVITRNRYGALVLNCANALFVDVDFPKPSLSGLLSNIVWAFRRRRGQVEAPGSNVAGIRKVEAWAGRNPGRGFRLYRTKEGLRLLFTDRLYDPASEETAAILAELEADPLYVRLTQKQECFRARLTVKPWRCGIPRPPSAFPWDSPKEEAVFRQWEADYTRRDAEFKVCELIRAFGPPAKIGALKTIVDVHDRGAKINANAPLA